MKENISTFSNPFFGTIRATISASNEPLIGATDLARTLGYSISNNCPCTGLTSRANTVPIPLDNGRYINFLTTQGVKDVLHRTKKKVPGELRSWLNNVYASVRDKAGTRTENRPVNLYSLVTRCHNIQSEFIEAVRDNQTYSLFIDGFEEHMSNLVNIIGQVIGMKVVEERFK